MNKQQRFRDGPLTLWRWAALYGTAFGLPIGLLLVLQGSNWLALLLSEVVAIGIFLILSLAAWVYPIDVKTEGLRLYDFQGRYGLLAWDDPIECEPWRFFGLRYLRVRRLEDGRVFTLPLYLSEMDRFLHAIEARTFADHPLVTSLRKFIANS
ncbi:MAG: hypothetical protein AAF800_06845 [Planctomycetota bacterium]